jgi:hypothetical protein
VRAIISEWKYYNTLNFSPATAHLLLLLKGELSAMVAKLAVTTITVDGTDFDASDTSEDCGPIYDALAEAESVYSQSNVSSSSGERIELVRTIHEKRMEITRCETRQTASCQPQNS